MIDKKLDKIIEDVGEIKTHLAVYNEQLKTHIKRTEILEQKLEPVEKHVERLNGALKLLGVLTLIAGVIEAFIRLR
jgi:DNA repair ATPase RecN